MCCHWLTIQAVDAASWCAAAAAAAALAAEAAPAAIQGRQHYDTTTTSSSLQLVAWLQVHALLNNPELPGPIAKLLADDEMTAFYTGRVAHWAAEATSAWPGKLESMQLNGQEQCQLSPEALFCTILIIIQPVQSAIKCHQLWHGHMQGHCLSLHHTRPWSQ